MINTTMPYQIQKDQIYTAKTQNQKLNGKIIEVNNTPYAKIGDDGNLYTISGDDVLTENVTEYTISPEPITQRLDLDTDTFFNE